jgi:hypothetical protein
MLVYRLHGKLAWKVGWNKKRPDSLSIADLPHQHVERKSGIIASPDLVPVTSIRIKQFIIGSFLRCYLANRAEGWLAFPVIFENLKIRGSVTIQTGNS